MLERNLSNQTCLSKMNITLRRVICASTLRESPSNVTCINFIVFKILNLSHLCYHSVDMINPSECELQLSQRRGLDKINIIVCTLILERNVLWLFSQILDIIII